MNGSGSAVALALKTLANELGCAPDQIAVEEAMAVTWPNSALGCPQAGMMVMQVLTPGYRVRLRHGGQEFVVHTDQGRRAVRCASPATPYRSLPST